MWVLTSTIHDNEGEVVCGMVAEFEEQPDFEVVEAMIDSTLLDDEFPAMVVSLTFGGLLINVWERVLDAKQN